MPSKIIDACSLINLYASGCVIEVLRVFEGGFYIPRQVREESLSIRKADEEDPTRLVPEPVDLDNLLRHGLLQECAIEGADEAEWLLHFATELGDGEAACLAIAKVRGWTVATDDKKAIRIAASEGIAVITTPELVQRWVQACHPTKDELRLALRNIEVYARFRLGQSARLYSWWKEHTAGERKDGCR